MEREKDRRERKRGREERNREREGERDYPIMRVRESIMGRKR